MQDNNIIQKAINILERLYKENAELKVHIKDEDEYISSLLLSLFLMQGEVDRLNKILDLARKGELVYINNPQVAELKAENERLEEDLGTACISCANLIAKDNEIDKYRQVLQEIKEIAEKECKDCLDKRSDSCWICPYYPILDLITKAEVSE